MSGIEAQLFRSFIDAMPYGVCLVDLQRKIAYWNSAAEEITGYLGHEYWGAPFEEICSCTARAPKPAPRCNVR